jgi:hypothetical protein
MKPSGIDLNLKYQCPNCEADHWATFKEAQTPGFKIVCHCDFVLCLTQISKVDCYFTYTDKVKQEVRDALISLGYKERDFGSILKHSEQTTKEELMREVIRNVQA